VWRSEQAYALVFKQSAASDAVGQVAGPSPSTPRDGVPLRFACGSAVQHPVPQEIAAQRKSA